MSIRERAGSFLNKLHDKAGYGKAVTASDLEQFSESERALQRQECAEAYRNKSKEFEFVVVTDITNAILTAGTEPTNPFGCACWRIVNGGWEHDTKYGAHTLHHEQVACQWCGAKRRKQ